MKKFFICLLLVSSASAFSETELYSSNAQSLEIAATSKDECELKKTEILNLFKTGKVLVLEKPDCKGENQYFSVTIKIFKY